MNRYTRKLPALSRAMLAMALGTGATIATATEPCDDFGECKAMMAKNQKARRSLPLTYLRHPRIWNLTAV